MKHSLFIILTLFCFGITAFANGDPVIRYSSVTRSGNPVPRTITEVEVVHESLIIRPRIPFSDIIVEYTLRNNSSRDILDIDYGFPIDYEGTKDHRDFYDDGISESIYEEGWWYKNLTNVSFSLNRKELPWHSADEVVVPEHKEAWDDEIDDNDPESWWMAPQISRLWTYTRFSIKAHETVTLRVCYSLYHTQYTSVYPAGYSYLSRYFTRSGIITYDFSPAQHWGSGSAGSLDILVDMGELPDEYIWLHESDHNGHTYSHRSPELNWSGFIRDGRTWVYHADDFDFASSEPLTLRFDSDFHKYSREEQVPWEDISVFEIPASKYEVTYSGADTIDIHFPEPLLVTDLSYLDYENWLVMKHYKWRKYGKEVREYEVKEILVTNEEGMTQTARDYQWLSPHETDNRYKTYFVTLNNPISDWWIFKRDKRGELVRDENGYLIVDGNHSNLIKHIRIVLEPCFEGLTLPRNPICNIRLYNAATR